MEEAVKTIVTTFVSHAKGKENLKSGAFKKMVQQNFSSIMEDTDSSSAIKEMQQGLDANDDGEVSFQEYLTLIGYVANSMSKKVCDSYQVAAP
ncbi:S100-A16-like [Solea senegalensis]|uniref:S100-A16-like n=2 Tax=Solea senegalensis TaxID=28829 RepID=A0AAV6PUR9_SOLSE|nr:protein S100-A16 [Solea senegalensis]KAG7474995.1 S100-A16-like [Solea senegalensis]